MKYVTVILLSFIILSSAFLFAESMLSSASVYASLKLVPILPNFSMYGSLDGSNFSAIASDRIGEFNPESPAPYNLVTDTDITTDPVTVYIKVIQFGKVHYLTSGLNLTVSATALIMDDTNEDHRTDPPSIVEDSIWADSSIDIDNDGASDFTSSLISASESTVTYHVAYPTGIQIPAVFNDEAVTVGGFAYRWMPVESLPSGRYHANVTMTYTVN